jgi:fatty-acyl-CoA synthase
MLKFRDLFTRAAFAFALALPLWFLIASFGTRFGLFDWRFGFGTMTFRLGPPLLIGAIAAGAVALGLALLVKPRGPLLRPLVALAVPLGVAGVAAFLLGPARSVPPIHDVATDTVNPPRFGQAIERARAAVEGGNGVQPMDAPLRTLPTHARAATAPRLAAYAEKSVGEIVREHYPDLKPLRLASPPDEAFAWARQAAEAEGWKIVRVEPATWELDATDTLFWYGFKDDVAVRVRPDGAGGSIIDVRSASRVGLSDVGVNAKRVRAYLARFETPGRPK